MFHKEEAIITPMVTIFYWLSKILFKKRQIIVCIASKYNTSSGFIPSFKKRPLIS